MASATHPGRSAPARAREIVALLWALCVVLPGCKRPSEGTEPPIRVAAAADLALAFEELGRGFEQQTGERVTFSFGSTGLLAQQLREGAPFDLFAAANVSFVDAAVAFGACDGATKAPYARGRIAVVSPKARGGAAPELAALGSEGFRRIAIANPEHAPYGMAARQALERAGVWERVRARMVYGENVRQALQFVDTRNADAGVVALALVAGGTDRPFTLVDEALHDPIEQALVVCTRGARPGGGAAFAAYVRSETGRAVMRRHGFSLPGEGAGEGGRWAK